MSRIIKVGMADYGVLKAPGILTTLGLGSCVGITLFDSVAQVGGLAHIMLPSSKQIRNNENKAKFADTAILLLIDDMVKQGAMHSRLICKLAGGAQMFSFHNKKNDMLKIGERNVSATKEVLYQLNIPIISQDTGGNFGRTIEFRIDTGVLLVKTIGYGVKEI